MERYCATSRSFCDGALSKAEGVKRKGSGMIERRFFFFFFLKESKSWKREAVSAFLLQHTHKSHVMRHAVFWMFCALISSSHRRHERLLDCRQVYMEFVGWRTLEWS